MEAQRFPDDFDGIIAGAPANKWTHLMVAHVWDEQATLGNPASYIPFTKLPAITTAALAACDAQDGIVDGIINDPQQCHFDPSSLMCSGAESPGMVNANVSKTSNEEKSNVCCSTPRTATKRIS